MLQYLMFLAQELHLVYWLWVGCLGLVIGSFLNVVVHRLPIMIDRQANTSSTTRFNLLLPRSFCPHCQASIAGRYNIPVLSYFWLRGQSRCCNKPISKRYPLIEIIAMLCTLLIAYHFQISVQTPAALILIWSLIALVFIDIDHQILPDDITLPLIWVGLLINVFHTFTTPTDAIIGAIAGYLIFWSVGFIFKLIRGFEGMGQGDAKLLAAIGAWLGWQLLPLVIMVSATTGCIIGLLYNFIQQRSHQEPIPFGPFIALGGIVALLWGNTVVNTYLTWSVPL